METDRVPARNLIDKVKHHVEGMAEAQRQRLDQVLEFENTVRQVQDYCDRVEAENIRLTEQAAVDVARIADLETSLSEKSSALHAAVERHAASIEEIRAAAAAAVKKIEDDTLQEIEDVRAVAQSAVAGAEKRAMEMVEQEQAISAGLRSELEVARTECEQLGSGIALLLSAIESNTLAAHDEDTALMSMIAALRGRIEHAAVSVDVPSVPATSSAHAETLHQAVAASLETADILELRPQASFIDIDPVSAAAVTPVPVNAVSGADRAVENRVA